FLLEDLHSPTLLTQSRLLGEVSEAGGFSGPVLCLDRELLEGEPSTLPATGATDPQQLAYINYTSDAATFEIWGALLNGAALVLIERATVLDLPALSRRIAEEGITVLYLTTALFNQVIEQAWEGLRGVKTLIVGGETASVPHFRRAVERLAGTRLINEYGPTENTSFSSWHLVAEVPVEGALPIGRPLSSSTVY